MPSSFECVSCRCRRRPAAARPWPGVVTSRLFDPCHSMPTCLTPKSSCAWILKLSCSESSTTFCRGRSSHASDGASSSWPLTASVNGSLPARPNSSCQWNSSLRDAVHQRRRAGDIAPFGRQRTARRLGHSASSRLAVAVNCDAAAVDQRHRAAAHVLANLVSGRPRYSGSVIVGGHETSARAAASVRRGSLWR